MVKHPDPGCKWEPMKGKTKKISKSKAINDKANVKNCKE